MQITNIGQSTSNGIRELYADVLYENENVLESLYIRMPDCGTANPCPADSFFVNMILVSMLFGEKLTLDSPVSRDVYTAVMQHTVPLMRHWHPRLHEADVEVELNEPAPQTMGDTCVLFSGGLDSWQALVARREELDSLVHIRGFEMNIDNADLWDAAHSAVRHIAADFDKQVVVVSTNILETTMGHIWGNQLLNWDAFGVEAWYGHMLCAIGLALRPQASSLLIPSSWADATEAVASSSEVEPTLTTAAMGFAIVGGEFNRMQKLDDLQRNYPAFIRKLRVCVKKDFVPTDQVLNCGQCVKCMRTQVELLLCGIPYAATLFAMPLELDLLKCTKASGNRLLWDDVIKEATRRGRHDVATALTTMLNQPRWRLKMHRFMHRLRKRLTIKK